MLSEHKMKQDHRAWIQSKIPPLPIIRTTIKATVATTISIIFVLADSTRASIGSASTMTTLGVLLYFPVRSVAFHTKLTIQGALSAAIGSAWCVLGNYVANLARDPAIASPLQPASSAVSAVFSAVLVFTVAYVRSKYPQLSFITVFAGMIGSFALTTNASTPGFQPAVTVMTFFKPILFATAISLMVNWFLWPEDGSTQYFETLDKTLQDYTLFYSKMTESYRARHATMDDHNTPTFPKLREQLQSGFIKLVDSQHNAEFIVLYSRLSQSDMRNITQKVKEMRTPLHGLGVSLLCKQENHLQSPNTSSLYEKELEEATENLIQGCIAALDECRLRIDTFRERPRTLLSTVLWPFPRFVGVSLSNLDNVQLNMSPEKLELLILAYQKATQRWRLGYDSKAQVTQQVAYLFQFNLLGFANSVQSLASFVEKLDLTRPRRRRLWLPTLSLKRWLRPSVSDKSHFGGQVNSRISIAESSIIDDQQSYAGDVDSELGLSEQAQTIEKGNEEEEDAYVCIMNQRKRPCPRDPDVDAPVTFVEKCFDAASKFIDWIYSMETVFAIKTAAGFVLLSIPALLPQSIGWFTQWGGQWVANTLLMWMIPMAGQFNFTLILGLLGTICGGVLSIIVFEIVRGNPYGIAVLSFIVMAPFHNIVLRGKVYSFFAIMTQYAYLMVMTTGYQNALKSTTGLHNVIEMAAGMRMLYIVLGIVGSFLVNLIPRPVTGRVELRKRISRTLYDMSILYGIIFADIMRDHSKDSQQGSFIAATTTPNQVKAFRQLTVHIQRQLKDEQTYLRLSRLEPPLKGKFPHDTYQTLIEKLNNMADLIEGMAYTSRSLDGSWRYRLIHALNQEKLDYIACLITVMRQLSATLLAKIPLPPHLISPDDLKDKISQKLCDVVSMHQEQVVNNDTFPSYCAYSVASYVFTQELNEAFACVEQLVGVEDPQVWLAVHV